MAVQGDLQLSIGYWIVSHRDQLKKWWALLLLGFIAFSAVWTILFTLVFFWQQAGTDRLLVQAASGLKMNTLQSFAPQDLVADQVEIFVRDAKHVDLMAMVENSNSAWGAAVVRYHFTVNGQTLPSQTTFLNPEDSRPVIQLNVSAQAPTQAVFTLESVTWQRASEAALPASTFTSTDPSVSRTSITLGTETVNTFSAKLMVTNRSVYNYYRVIVPVLLKSGERVVAVDQVTLERWPTLTDRTVTVTWPFAIDNATTVEVMPQVSRFDRDNVYR